MRAGHRRAFHAAGHSAYRVRRSVRRAAARECDGAGRCLFGYGEADGDNRAHEALARALRNPLMDRGRMLDESHNVLVNVAGGPDMTLNEVQMLMEALAKHTGEETQILFGASVDPEPLRANGRDDHFLRRACPRPRLGGAGRRGFSVPRDRSRFPRAVVHWRSREVRRRCLSRSQPRKRKRRCRPRVAWPMSRRKNQRLSAEPEAAYAASMPVPPIEEQQQASLIDVAPQSERPAAEAHRLPPASRAPRASRASSPPPPTRSPPPAPPDAARNARRRCNSSR